MGVDAFDFHLPPERIALRPARPRDAARMLVVEGGAIGDAGVRDLPQRLRAGDCLVFNDTRVIPAQLERSEEHTSELQSLMRISYAVFCLKKKHTIHLNIKTTISILVIHLPYHNNT